MAIPSSRPSITGTFSTFCGALTSFVHLDADGSCAFGTKVGQGDDDTYHGTFKVIEAESKIVAVVTQLTTARVHGTPASSIQDIPPREKCWWFGVFHGKKALWDEATKDGEPDYIIG